MRRRLFVALEGWRRIWLLITGNDNGVTVGTFRSRLFDLRRSERPFAASTMADFWKTLDESIQRHQEEKTPFSSNSREESVQ